MWQRPFATEYELVIAAALTVFGPRLILTDHHPATGRPPSRGYRVAPSCGKGCTPRTAWH
ncbi:hypothetical protein [Streptomyces griseocarneus]|uniref:hypothetical protein n=1 Tax=Streptomyces griseocarneus TaxID=51201 RepID=UPI00167D10D5|nr:hypothetical protein [Streptomyces griseocarneus]MBZ6476225.1 hypothetical protein [Streptomyces griseocarneus]GHG63269.1 hypothetical protein GCM10018779_32710 [Streptomyces griseocarneus]